MQFVEGEINHLMLSLSWLNLPGNMDIVVTYTYYTLILRVAHPIVMKLTSGICYVFLSSGLT